MSTSMMKALNLGSLLMLAPCLANAESFLIGRRSSLKSQMTAASLHNHVSDAMGEALGCGGHVSSDDIAGLEYQLLPIWRALPKNAEGNVDRRSLRTAIHRHFNRHWALHIRGFEPSRSQDAMAWGKDDILGRRVPAYVESVLESKHKSMRGFTLTDAAYMVATIEQLIFDWEGVLLEGVYDDQAKSLTESMGFDELVRVLETYVVQWLLHTDSDTTFILLTNTSLLERSVPHWPEVSKYIQGNIRKLEHHRRLAPGAAMKDGVARQGHNALSSLFSFEDVHAIVASIRQSFGLFWDSECASLKSTLIDMDTHRTGRVPLSKFHGTGMEADWRFGESEEYLRELGALDATSTSGKQVIVPNYMQAVTNCVVTTPHYLVCCLNECEPLLAEIEAAIGQPEADLQQLLDVVSGMAPQSTVDDDFSQILRGTLPQQLEQIAAAHNGRVPLHGRLFAQWLHYAFPRECAFPHKAGTVSFAPPSEYGDDFYATPEEMSKHASTANHTSISTSIAEESLEWMSQWSPEEELSAELVPDMEAPWEQRAASSTRTIFAVLSIFGLAFLARVRSSSFKREVVDLPTTSRQHYV